MVMSAASELNLEGAGFTELQISNENADYTFGDCDRLFLEVEVLDLQTTDILAARGKLEKHGSAVTVMERGLASLNSVKKEQGSRPCSFFTLVLYSFSVRQPPAELVRVNGL